MKSPPFLCVGLLLCFISSWGRAEMLQNKGIHFSVPKGWTRLEVGDQFSGLAAYCDSGQITLYIDRLPFASDATLDELDRSIISDARKKTVSKVADFNGHGFRKSGLTRDGPISYTFFVPDNPKLPVSFVLIVLGAPTAQRISELEGIFSTLQVDPVGH
jgi:hypothetical protein